jgi:hypothetical protein
LIRCYLLELCSHCGKAERRLTTGNLDRQVTKKKKFDFSKNF